jgi:SIR2-like domain
MSISNLFIVGAGFTRAVFHSAPLNKELLCQIVGSKDDSTLRRVWAEYGSTETDIERLLTRFDLDLMTHSSRLDGRFGETERDAISREIAEFVNRFRFKKDVEWLHPFLDQTLEKKDVIISLNYDCFLEGFLDSHEAWSPNGGYGDIGNASDGLDDSPLDNPRNIRILKIHGSESFRLVRFLNEPESMSVGAIINEQLFPRSGKNKHFKFSGEVGPYVIAPSFMKQFMVDLQFLLVEAIRCAERARNLIIIGCGLRPEDNHLWLVVSSFMKSEELEKKRIFIVSPNASDTKKKIKEFWGRKTWGRNARAEEKLIAIDSDFESGLPRLTDALRQA